MIKAINFQLQSYLLSIFTPHANFSFGVILAEMMRGFGKVFDGQVLSLPLPPEAPADIPRITLPSGDQRLKLELSPARANIYRLRTEEDRNIDVREFLQRSGEIFEKYIQASGAVVGRVASVVVKTDAIPSPGLELAKHFCKQDRLTTVLNRPESFELHAHKTYTLGEFNVNSWVRNKTGRIGRDKRPVIVIEQDLNTLQEESQQKRFSNADIRHFHELADAAHESILEKYYPSDV